MMRGKHLLLLAGFMLLARCQQKPKVSISPSLKQYFTGDVFSLTCNSSSSGSVIWYYNNEKQDLQDNIWKVAATSPHHSGSYECEINGQKSDNVTINVQEYTPIASLSIWTGQPVMQTGTSVVLKIELEDVLLGWNCWDYRGGRTRKIKLRLKNDTRSLSFQPYRLNDPEVIFWCTDTAETLRSNQIVVRTSTKKVSLEMYPLPAVDGEALTLRCLAWGTNKISKAVFYKDNVIISNGNNPSHEIKTVDKSTKGSYKCDATFTYTSRTNGPPYQVTSEAQDVFVQEPPMKAELSYNVALSCSCKKCHDGVSYHWYKTDDRQSWELMRYGQDSKMMPTESGTYACRAVWPTKKTLLSQSYVYQRPITSILTNVLIVLVIVVFIVAAALVIYTRYKKRNTTGPIYEDVALRSRDRGDDKYETLQKPHGAQKDGEYDTLNPEATGGQKKGGEYEPLNKTEVKEGVYHTLGMEGAVGGGGGYEALKKEGMKEGEYHTLGAEGAVGGVGGGRI
ncbi:hypothetical protein L3Q82_010704 [Scortum barcoo]|uniref:Uncharacterized protein n=1 Tax=Scortum barcoo TaxID=214431 RepID=A0ACB8WEE1_9TELE|nr:hypothetical protein L3Q82_010704 [Scortum barcoo]